MQLLALTLYRIPHSLLTIFLYTQRIITYLHHCHCTTEIHNSNKCLRGSASYNIHITHPYCVDQQSHMFISKAPLPPYPCYTHSPEKAEQSVDKLTNPHAAKTPHDRGHGRSRCAQRPTQTRTPSSSWTSSSCSTNDLRPLTAVKVIWDRYRSIIRNNDRISRIVILVEE